MAVIDSDKVKQSTEQYFYTLTYNVKLIGYNKKKSLIIFLDLHRLFDAVRRVFVWCIVFSPKTEFINVIVKLNQSLFNSLFRHKRAKKNRLK